MNRAQWLSLLITAATPIGACSVPLQSTWFTDQALLAGETATRSATLEVTPQMGPLHVRLSVTTQTGTASWELLDPSGVRRWKCSTGPAQQLVQECEISGPPGTWTILREWVEFTGSHGIEVSATTPGQVKLTVR